MTIYLDLDGVFADFRKKFAEVCGFEYDENPKLAWSLLEKEDRLFYNLEPLPNAIEFYQIIVGIATAANVEYKFLTALPKLTGNLITAPSDKRIWVNKYLDIEAQVICTDGWRGKKMFCVNNDILIDDMERNIKDWESVGGRGILHKDWKETLVKLTELLT